MSGTTGLLLLSVGLSAGRNILTKRVAVGGGGKGDFFLSQGMLFSAAALLLICYHPDNLLLSPVTLWLGLAYGVLLLSSQWMYTLALRGGAISVCSTVYALGFLLPTLSGAVLWGENFTLTDGIGLGLALFLLMLTSKEDSKQKREGRHFVPFLLIAMVSSGGLGIMQKVQQASPAASQKEMFLLIAFSLAAVCSFGSYFVCRQPAKICKGVLLYPAIVGLCFGGANLCNTMLAGRMRSAVFFPVQNIGTIVLSVIVGVLAFREKLTRRTAVILLLGIAVVLLFSI